MSENKTVPKPIRRVAGFDRSTKQPIYASLTGNVDKPKLYTKKSVINKIIDRIFWVPVVRFYKKIKEKEASIIQDVYVGRF